MPTSRCGSMPVRMWCERSAARRWSVTTPRRCLSSYRTASRQVRCGGWIAVGVRRASRTIAPRWCAALTCGSRRRDSSGDGRDGETRPLVTPMRSATCCWVRPRARRTSARRCPTVSASIWRFPVSTAVSPPARSTWSARMSCQATWLFMAFSVKDGRDVDGKPRHPRASETELRTARSGRFSV